MKDMYEKFAYDYDEFGDIKNYLGPEKEFFQTVFQENDVKYRQLFDDDYQKLLTEAGFQQVHFYGDYRRNPYTQDSRRLLVVAK